MDLWTAIKVIVRRWYLVVPALVLTVIVAFIAAGRVTPVYTATGSVMFTAPNQRFYPTDTVDEERVEQVNPYNDFSASLQTTATIVGDKLASDEVRDTFADNDLEKDFKVAAPYDPTRTVLAPTLEFDVEASDPDVAVATVVALQEAAQVQLNALQVDAAVRQELYIKASPLITPEKAIEQNALKVRVLGIVLLLGFALALSLAFTAESLLSSRAARRSAEDRVNRRISPDSTSRRARPTRASGGRGTGNGSGNRPVRTR
jgi:uncharacterized protein involved in exopolysaccharide biosynthesis